MRWRTKDQGGVGNMTQPGTNALYLLTKSCRSLSASVFITAEELSGIITGVNQIPVSVQWLGNRLTSAGDSSR